MLNLNRNCNFCGAASHGKVQPPYNNGHEDTHVLIPPFPRSLPFGHLFYLPHRDADDWRDKAL